MAFMSSAVYLVMASFLGFVACIGAAVRYLMRQGDKEEAVIEAPRPAQVLTSGDFHNICKTQKCEDCQSLQAHQVEGQRARPVNRAQAGVRRRQRAAAAAQQQQQQDAASDESGGSEVAVKCSQSTNNKVSSVACMLCFCVVQLPVSKLRTLLATG